MFVRITGDIIELAANICCRPQKPKTKWANCAETKTPKQCIRNGRKRRSKHTALLQIFSWKRSWSGQKMIPSQFWCFQMTSLIQLILGLNMSWSGPKFPWLPTLWSRCWMRDMALLFGNGSILSILLNGRVYLLCLMYMYSCERDLLLLLLLVILVLRINGSDVEYKSNRWLQNKLVVWNACLQFWWDASTWYQFKTHYCNAHQFRYMNWSRKHNLMHTWRL